MTVSSAIDITVPKLHPEDLYSLICFLRVVHNILAKKYAFGPQCQDIGQPLGGMSHCSHGPADRSALHDSVSTEGGLCTRHKHISLATTTD